MSQKSFFVQILNLLKPETNADLEIQKKKILLIQRWQIHFLMTKMIILEKQYNKLKNNGIVFLST